MDRSALSARIAPFAGAIALGLLIAGCGDKQDSATTPMAGFDKQQAVAASIARLASPEATVRHAAVGALGRPEVADPAAVEPLRRVLREDPDENVRRAAARALFNEAYAATKPDLRHAARHDRSMWVRRDAIVSLGRFRDAESLELMRWVIEYSGEEVYTMVEAVKAVGAMGTGDAGRLLCDLLRREDLDRRLADTALDALAGMRHEVALEELLRVMDRKGFGVDAISASRLVEKHPDDAMVRLVRAYRQREQMLADGFRLPGEAFLEL